MNKIFENRQQGVGFGFLNKVDIFGVPIQINYNNESKHTTRFGGCVSLMIFSLLLTFLINLMISINQKTNPQVIQEEIIVDNPARFDLTDDNFTFAITLLDENFIPFLDESYYTVTSQFMYKVDVIQSDGTIKQDFKFQDVELERCTSTSFKVIGTEDYFLSQLYNNLYCIKDVSQLYLVGQFEKERFSVIQFNVNQCEGSSCQDPTEKERKLKLTQLQVYYTNSVVKVSNVKVPFQPIGQSQFWASNLSFSQVIDLNYMNTYVIDDVGLISQDLQTKNQLLFSSTRTMQSSSADLAFFQISLFMEKNRELQYNRKFLKLTEAVSQVGGIYNVLFFLGCVLAQPYSYLELERKIVNSTFTFSNKFMNTNNNKNNDKKKKKKNEKKQSQKHDQKSKIDAVIDTHLSKKDSSQMNKSSNNNQNIVNQNLNETFSNRDYIIGDIQEKGNTERPVLDKDKKKDIQENGEENNLQLKLHLIKEGLSEFKIRTIEYFTYYLRCFKYFQSDIQMILRFGTSKIFEFTDICYIVNKLIELEKIKHLILNEQQLRLFEYVPKPKITQNIIETYKNARDNDKQVKKAIKTKTQLTNSPQSRIQRKSTNQLNILTIMNRSQLEKAQEAQNAYNTIYKQQKKLSKIDKKLLLLLDENHIPLFNTNQFDSSIFGSYSSNGQINLNATINPSITMQDKEILDQIQNKKSIYFEQQLSSKNQEVNFTVNNSFPPIQADDISLPRLEDIQSSNSCVLNQPRNLYVKEASPVFQDNQQDTFQRDISQNISKYNDEKSSLQDEN